MNILPKKRWHVRTKDNIARVRRDEALAAEEERKKQQRIEIAEKEARTEALRKQARDQYGSHSLESVSSEAKEECVFSSGKHVNLFYELERNEIVSNATNKEYEEEKKLEKEKYEKQIGYLTYLGQDTNELTGNVSWYNKPREKISTEKIEISEKQKIFEDPLMGIRKYLGCEGVKKIAKTLVKDEKRAGKKISSKRSKKQKKDKKVQKSSHKKKKKRKKKHCSESEESSEEEEEDVSKKPKIDMGKLREERLKREMQERRKVDELFAKLNGGEVKNNSPPLQPVVQKYNSQFNPHLAKQNYL